MGLLGSIIGGISPIFGSIFGAHGDKKAIRDATAAQIAGINRGIDEEQRQFDLTRSDFAPWQQAGTAAVGDIGDILGLNGPDKQQAALDLLHSSPMYSSLFNNGQEALLQNASATGGLRGGNTERGLADFGADTFNQVIQSQLASLGGVAGAGANAVSNLGTLGANKANAVASGYTSIGNANSNSILGRQQVNDNLTNQIASMIKAAMGGMGGGGGAFAGGF